MKIFITLLLLSVLNTYSLNYYVAGDGNDSNEGYSIARPKKSFRWIEESSFAGGDTIFIKSGFTYREDIRLLGKNGEFGNELVVTSYGDGPSPIINGTLDASQWEAYDDGVHTNIFRIFVDSNSYINGSYDTLGAELTSLKNDSAYNFYDSAQVSLFLDSLTPESVGPILYRSTEYLYYKSSDALSPNDKRLITLRNSGFEVNNCNNIIIEDLTISSVGTGAGISFGDSVIFRNNFITETLAIGLQISSSGRASILNNQFKNTGNDAIYFVQNFNPVLIQGNRITGIADSIAGIPTTGDRNAIGYEIGTNITIQYNYIYDLSKKTFDFYFNDNITIRNNYVRNAGFASPYGVNSTIENNIYDAVDFASWSINGYMVMNDQLTDGDFYIKDNIIVGTDSLWAIRTNPTYAPDTVTGEWIIKGNLVHSNADSYYRIIEHVDDTSVVSDSNCYYNDGIEPTFVIGATQYTGFANYQTNEPNFDQNSIYSNILGTQVRTKPEDYIFNRDTVPCGNAGITSIDSFNTIQAVVGPRLKESSIINIGLPLDTVFGSQLKDSTENYVMDILGSGYSVNYDATDIYDTLAGTQIMGNVIKSNGTYSCAEDSNFPETLLQPNQNWSVGGWVKRLSSGGYVVSKSANYYNDRSAIYSRGTGYFIRSLGGANTLSLTGNQVTWNFYVWQNYFNGTSYVDEFYLNGVQVQAPTEHTEIVSNYKTRLGCRAKDGAVGTSPVLPVDGSFSNWFFITDSILSESDILSKYNEYK